MKDVTRIDWHRRVDEAVIRLLDNIDDPPGYAAIADELAASPDHFHRQFKTLTGETFKACADRLRLEKAMHMLREDRTDITGIAFECGFTTVEMLSRAVRKHFGLSPTRLRGIRSWHPFLPSRVGIHYTSRNERKTWFYVEGGDDMETKIVQFDDKLFYGYETIGDYWKLPELWKRFLAMIAEKGIGCHGTEYMSVFVDADDAVPREKKRAYAGFVMRERLADRFDLAEVLIPAGLYAVTVHFGSSESIGSAWEKWMKEWLPASGWESDYTRPNYEWYQNNHENPELLLTFLVTSVKRSG
jgi:AraC family transcriptional regulator